MSSSEMSVVITGASGLLGRAIFNTFSKGPWKKVTGTAFSRSGPGLVKVDLSDFDAVNKFLDETKPDFLVHSAAQRLPDKVAEDFQAAKRLNVEATEALAKKINSYGGKMLYISTDYVFDGENPPFKEEDPCSPLNDYGQLKLDGEKIALAVDKENLVLRIPVLYGPVEFLSESAVTVLLSKILEKCASTVVSDYEVRRPSHVDDIAEVVQDLLIKKLELGGPEVHGVYQWCGDEPMTKLGMVKVMSEALSLDATHVSGNDTPPPADAAVKRPRDTTMDRSKLEKLGINHHTAFKDGIKQALQKWVQ